VAIISRKILRFFKKTNATRKMTRLEAINHFLNFKKKENDENYAAKLMMMK
jgi:hypothetical protein